MNKKEARSYALNLRKNENNLTSSALVMSQIVSKKILSSFNNIGIYYPIGKEIDITILVNEYPNKNFYLPITREDGLHFIRYTKNQKLFDGPFKTKEPLGDYFDRDLIDAFLIPCVGISKDLKRIGYGKGYYDKYLAGYNGLKIGICYKDAANLDVDMDEFDLVLDMMVLA